MARTVAPTAVNGGAEIQPSILPTEPKTPIVPFGVASTQGGGGGGGAGSGHATQVGAFSEDRDRTGSRCGWFVAKQSGNGLSHGISVAQAFPGAVNGLGPRTQISDAPPD
jgi:hypothetical protein